MKHKKPLHTKCYAIKKGFLQLGFKGKSAFYNACKSIDVTLNGFQLVSFYDNCEASETLLSKLESILEMLKHE